MKLFLFFACFGYLNTWMMGPCFEFLDLAFSIQHDSCCRAMAFPTWRMSLSGPWGKFEGRTTTLAVPWPCQLYPVTFCMRKQNLWSRSFFKAISFQSKIAFCVTLWLGLDWGNAGVVDTMFPGYGNYHKTRVGMSYVSNELLSIYEDNEVICDLFQETIVITTWHLPRGCHDLHPQRKHHVFGEAVAQKDGLSRWGS